MRLELEACLSPEELKDGIDSIIGEALNSQKRSEKQEKLLIYIANYVRSNGELVGIDDLQELFEDSVCELAMLPARKKMEMHRKLRGYGGYLFVSGFTAAVVWFDPGFLSFAPISVGLGCWYWSSQMKKVDIQMYAELQNFKTKVANDLYSLFSEQTFKEIFDSVLNKYLALKEGKYV